jgi:hypothetical protein
MRGLGVLALGGIALSLVAGLPRLEVPAAVWREALMGLMLASIMGAALRFPGAASIARCLLRGFALGGAVRNVSLLWSATLGLAPPEGDLVMMLGTLWTLLLPALLGLRLWSPLRLGRALALAVLALAMI